MFGGSFRGAIFFPLRGLLVGPWPQARAVSAAIVDLVEIGPTGNLLAPQIISLRRRS
jgi:hypothetical protein